MDKVKILVLGDSGVGKSCFTHLISQNDILANANSTIGCNIDIKLHEFKEGTQDQKSFFLELWDVGGRPHYQNTRQMFYTSVHGIILVHDLTNRKSQDNLHKWLLEVLNRNNEHDYSGMDFDSESFVGTNRIPILVIGTKNDLIRNSSSCSRRTSTIASECGAEEIILNCLSTKSIAAGTGAAVKLSKYFDKVIQMKYQSELTIGSPAYASPRFYLD